MDLPENSNATDKPWDHPWSTDEIRQHRDDWSLAADAGLLKHLQQFADNLTERFKKTEEQLKSLNGELEEASVIIDNVTNASLALANTQFIESRVHEDDVEMEQPRDVRDAELRKEDSYPEDLIAYVGKSIKQGLNIMDEKFQRVEVVPSDSEDEGEIPIPSVVLKPNDPYQNRPLPYVIGTPEWKASSKVGLDLSSSDSEAPDVDEDSSGEGKHEIRQNATIPNNRRESLLRASLSSSSSELSGRNERPNATKDYSSVSQTTDKFQARSQDTLNSGSEIATPSVLESRTENSSRGAPSFAEELAKRLGNVLPGDRSSRESQEADQSSINRFKDDLLAPEDNDMFDSKTENLFSESNNLFDDDVSNSLWKNKPYRPPMSNIIPPSFDVPPPMHTEATKPKSAFDDLCGDPESDDSDNIFAPKSTTKSAASKSRSASDDNRESSDSKENKFLNVALGENASNMATSTPEINDNGGLFGDENDYEDDDVLFGNSGKSRGRAAERSPELSRTTNRPTLPGLSITQADILSSNLGSRLFQRVPRQASTDSSDLEPSISNPDPRANERIAVESDSSGISIRPNNSTTGNITNNSFGLGVDFQPQSESTRLKSEEIYRERYPSDSLYEGRTRQELSADNPSLEVNEARVVTGSLDHGRDEDFDVDDVFGPPPLPKHNDSKSKSNDDLFSNSSSESRSHKSFDLLSVASESQYDVKIASERGTGGGGGGGGGGGLFDEDVDIFGNSDVPEIDIFGEAFRSAPSNFAARDTSERPTTRVQSDSGVAPRINENPRSSFVSTGVPELPPVKSTPSIFDDSEEDDSDDLFGENYRKSERPVGKAMLDNEDDDIFAIKPSANASVLNETKKDLASLLAGESVAQGTTANARENGASMLARNDKVSNREKTLPNYSSPGLFDNLDEHDDVGLFSSDVTRSAPTKSKKSSDDDDAREEPAKKDKSDDSKKEPVAETQEFETTETHLTTSRTETPETTSGKDNTRPVTSLLDDENYSDISSTDGAKISKIRDPSDSSVENTKRDPPRTLSIRLPTSDDASHAPPRRAVVSSKIKKLQGKMGDLKILSPTDTPPMWRKSEEKTDSEADRTESRDSEDGGIVSVPSTLSPTTISRNEDIDTLPEAKREPGPGSPLEDSANSESAVSFDLPAQVEVLAVTASKSRARIQAKRRPQSRHARQSALRRSGIDFDRVDSGSTEAVDSDRSDSTFSGISDNVQPTVTDTGESGDSSGRLEGREIEVVKRSSERIVEAGGISLVSEDRSELSMSKASNSLSLNKHTLLSPSTDEEDLFDVPPDLPEDPPREDTLFGRAPILSPIDRLHVSRNKEIGKLAEDREAPSSVASDEKSHAESSRLEKSSETTTTARKATKTEEEPTDPLRDSSHDPLKDPSQLFAFVTKTPSPEKGQNVLFKEDASLFTHLARKANEEARLASQKPVLDLFADDTGGDLFTESLAKSSKKSIRAAKNDSLFDDVDSADEDFASDLFGTREKTGQDKIDRSITSRDSSEIIHEDLFVEASNKRISPEPDNLSDNVPPPGSSKVSTEATRIRDIFGDQSSGEEDLFAKSRVIGSGKNSGATGSLFSNAPDDEDNDDIFGTRASTRKPRKPEVTENRTSVKKTVTRDLKKTAETIVQDPLSMLQDD